VLLFVQYSRNGMGYRFRKSFKLAPGVRMNLRGSGLSWTLGPRWASVGIGKRGTFLNSGIPGSGLSSRQRIGGSTSTRTARSVPAKTHVSVTVQVADDGSVFFFDPQGNPLPDRLVDVVKRQQGGAIRDLIQQKCDEINEQVTALGEIHLHTPDPGVKPSYEVRWFEPQTPVRPSPKRPGILGALFKRTRERIERENAEAQKRHEQDMAMWQAAKRCFEEAESRRKRFIENDIYTDVSAMEAFLEENLQAIVWPRETNVSTEIRDRGSLIFIDVDLPEIEDMPSRTASAPQRGYKLSVKEMSPAQLQRLYMSHIHGIGFRIIGEAFAALPNAQQLVLSAFSQRPSSATGQVSDEYLYSARVVRDSWSRIAFDRLQNLDVVEALGQFDLRRNMTKTGRFRAIEPFGPSS
jgi:Protein of unknown function (DUF4236)